MQRNKWRLIDPRLILARVLLSPANHVTLNETTTLPAFAIRVLFFSTLDPKVPYSHRTLSHKTALTDLLSSESHGVKTTPSAGRAAPATGCRTHHGALFAFQMVFTIKHFCVIKNRVPQTLLLV